MSENTSTPRASCCCWDDRTFAFLILRLFLALRWLAAGFGKFQGDSGFSLTHWNTSGAGMVENFATNTFLPKFLLVPYVYPLPYIEALLGIGLLLGVKTRIVLILSGLMYVSLAFGQMLIAGHQTVANIAIHLALLIAALLLCQHNKLALVKD